MAAALGAEVTGVCSTRNAGLVRSIGAAHVIDYTTADFTGGRTRDERGALSGELGRKDGEVRKRRFCERQSLG